MAGQPLASRPSCIVVNLSCAAAQAHMYGNLLSDLVQDGEVPGSNQAERLSTLNTWMLGMSLDICL